MFQENSDTKLSSNVVENKKKRKILSHRETNNEAIIIFDLNNICA